MFKNLLNLLINNKKGMMGSTHAAGALALILYLGLFILPVSFFEQISLWIYILAVYVGQLPDIDHPESNISRNPFVRPFAMLLKGFIEGHRAKETHSFFGAFVFGIFAIPIAISFGIPSWIALIIAYSSHFILDFFNPTGAKLFYFPFLNSNPRSRSINNVLKNIIIWKHNDTRTEKGVKTGEFIENNIISLAIWGFLVFATFLSFSVLWNRVAGDSYLLAASPLLAITGLMWILISPKIIKLVMYLFKGIVKTADLKIKAGTTQISKSIKDFFHFSVVAQVLFLILFVSSLRYTETYSTSFKNLKTEITSVYNKEITFKEFSLKEFKVLTASYSLGYDAITKEGLDKLNELDLRGQLENFVKDKIK